LPVDFKIDHAERFVWVRAHGVVRLQEILHYFDALVVQEAMAYPKLFDARDADPELSDDDVMILGARVSAYAAFDPRGAIGAVAATRKAGDILQRFMNLGSAQRPMRLFATPAEARAWLVSER
jgi:hypothetical protein